MVKATYQDTAFNKAVSDVPAHTPEFKTYVEQASASYLVSSERPWPTTWTSSA